VKPVRWLGLAAFALTVLSLWGFWLAIRPPRLAIPGSPADYRLNAEDVALVADDGVRLAGWLVPATGARPPAQQPAVILLHGYPANKADLLPLATALHRGFTLLLVDFRYFGASGGRVTTLGLRERRDVRHAVSFLADRGYTRIGAFGYSLGGAVALMAAAEDPRIRAVAAWAPFADLRQLGRDVYSVFWLLKYPLVELMVLWGRLGLGGDMTRPSPETAAARLAIPVQLWASHDDEQIPFAHAERLRIALRGNPRAEFHVGRGRHNERAAGFEQRLADFFDRSL